MIFSLERWFRIIGLGPDFSLLFCSSGLTDLGSQLFHLKIIKKKKNTHTYLTWLLISLNVGKVLSRLVKERNTIIIINKVLKLLSVYVFMFL